LQQLLRSLYTSLSRWGLLIGLLARISLRHIGLLSGLDGALLGKLLLILLLHDRGRRVRVLFRLRFFRGWRVRLLLHLLWYFGDLTSHLRLLLHLIIGHRGISPGISCGAGARAWGQDHALHATRIRRRCDHHVVKT